jgi:hypothetical protein
VRALVVVGAVVVLSGCGGEDPQRAEIRGYIERTNAVQARFAGDFQRADAAFKAFAKGEPTDAAVLEIAESDIRAAQAAVAAVRAPARAATVHDRLLRVYAIDADLAHETLQLARYRTDSPAALRPLDAASKRLRGELRAARRPATQARALNAFSRALLRTLHRLRALDVPQILAPSHAAQLARLERTRALTGRLRDAVRERDSRRVARLLLRFRAGGEAERAQKALMKQGAATYTGRLQRLAQAQVDLSREQARLRKSVG